MEHYGGGSQLPPEVRPPVRDVVDMPDSSTAADDAASSIFEDISDPSLYVGDGPERTWKALRAVGRPLYLRGRRPHWAVTRYAHVESVLRNAARFSTERGMQLGWDATAEAAARAASGKSLLVTDDPLHAELRRAIAGAFTSRAVARLRDGTDEAARRLVFEAASGGTVDFVEAVAGPLPAAVTCDLLGVPPLDRARVMELTQQAFGDNGPDPSTSQLAANAELFAYCDELVTTKRKRPGDDVATLLAQATVGGDPMSHEVAVLNCHDLIVAGNETSRHAAAAAAVSMVTDPLEWAALRAGAVRVEEATEEILRLGAPLSHVMRTAREDVRVGGVVIRQGELVALWLRSANRDEEVFDRAEEMRFGRRPNKHLTFGLGTHFCLGSLLARLEVSAVVRALVEIVDGIELAGEPKRLRSNFLRGYTAVPLSMRRRTA